MTEEYDIIADGRNFEEAEAVWDSPLTLAPGSNMEKLLNSLFSEYDRIDSELEEIYEQHHIDSATNDSLKQYGDLVGVQRKTDENDNSFRSRIKAEFRQSTIEPTFDQFTEFCATIFNTSIENLEFILNLSGDPATVDIGINSKVIEDTDLSDTEIIELLSGGVPAGHEVKVFEGGTFRLKEDGETDNADRGLTSDSIETGGTLAEDLL